MNANPMEEQIGRLVGNLLAGGGEIFLPGVGSLYTERQGARRLNRRTVLPPSRTVAFTSQQRGVSLVDEIARVMREAGGYENPEAEAQARLRPLDRPGAPGRPADRRGRRRAEIQEFYPRRGVRSPAESAGARTRASSCAASFRLAAVGRHRGNRDCGGLWRAGVPAALSGGAGSGGRDGDSRCVRQLRDRRSARCFGRGSSDGTVCGRGVRCAGGGRGFGGFRSRCSPGTGDRRNASGAGAGRPDGVAFGPPLCRAGGFQH